MRIPALILLLCSLFCKVSAQGIRSNLAFKGTLVDSLSGKPLPYVTVSLQDLKTKVAIKTVVSKEDGSFAVVAPENKDLLLVLASTGYNDQSIVLLKGAERILGAISLSLANKQMKEYTVVAARPVIKRDLDGITYDVSADPETPALSVLDIMRKVPLLSVDASDNIKLKGKGNYKILINGKESSMLAKNPSDVLRSMPATNIEKIEVITTPPAKYDAEGLAGIINIITKKKIDEGYNIGINGRLNSIWGPGINLNGTYKKGKFGLSGYAGYNVRNIQTNSSGSDQLFFADHSTLSQNGTHTQGSHNNYGNAEWSYEFDSLNFLNGSIEFYNGDNKQGGNLLSNNFDFNQTILQAYRLLSDGRNTYQGTDVDVTYQHGFKRDKNQLLTISYRYGYSPNTQHVDYIITDTINYRTPSFRQYNNSGNKEHTFRIDYVQPFKKVTMEVGGKVKIRNNFSDFESNVYNDSSKDYLLNPEQTNDFNYNQDIYSFYNSYQVKWSKWNAKAGYRLENTTVHANFVSEASTVNQNYTNLIPSLSIQRSLNLSSLTLGYTDRINRPGIDQLNPFVDKGNPNFISTGNPNLHPEINHSFEINYSRFTKTSVTIGMSYSFSNNSIQTVNSLQVDSLPNNTKDTVTLTTFQNLGNNRDLGMNFNVNFSKIENLSISLNGQVSHVWLKGTYNGQFFRNDGYTGNAFVNAGYKFGKGYRVGLDAGVFSGDVNLQGKSSSFLFTSYLLSKSFLDKKLTLSLVAINPYSRFFNNTSTITTPDFHQSSYNETFYRSFSLRFNFKFGKLNSDIARNRQVNSNDDTKSAKPAGGNQ